MERKIRRWSKQYGKLYIITGGILEKDLPTIGEEDVAVPKRYYKIVVKEDGRDIKVLAFLIPHKDTKESLSNFLVSVDDLEELSGIDFFSKMDENIESRLERSINKKHWKF